MVKTLVVFAAFLLSLAVVPSVYARRGGGSGFEEQRIEIRDDQRFRFRGVVDSVSDNSFVLGGQTVFIDPSQVEGFRQRGDFSTGSNVRVRGIMINGTNFASEIRVR